MKEYYKNCNGCKRQNIKCISLNDEMIDLFIPCIIQGQNIYTIYYSNECNKCLLNRIKCGYCNNNFSKFSFEFIHNKYLGDGKHSVENIEYILCDSCKDNIVEYNPSIHSSNNILIAVFNCITTYYTCDSDYDPNSRSANHRSNFHFIPFKMNFKNYDNKFGNISYQIDKNLFKLYSNYILEMYKKTIKLKYEDSLYLYGCYAYNLDKCLLYNEIIDIEYNEYNFLIHKINEGINNNINPYKDIIIKYLQKGSKRVEYEVLLMKYNNTIEYYKKIRNEMDTEIENIKSKLKEYEEIL